MAAGFAALMCASPAMAAPTVFSGFDAGANGPGANATAAAAAFDLAVSGATLVTFESALPVSLSILGGSITSNSGCEASLCGGNTTSGGSQFLSLYGGNSTFNFSPNITAFGAFFGGIQIAALNVAFFDGSSQSITIPSDLGAGGFAFVGFTNPTSISSVTVHGFNDILTVDDVRFGGAGVPEPATWAMLLAGFGLAGTALRSARRRTAITAA